MPKRRIKLRPSPIINMFGIQYYLIRHVNWPKGYTGKYIKVPKYIWGSFKASVAGCQRGELDFHKFNEITKAQTCPAGPEYFLLVEAHKWDRLQEPIFDKRGNEICP